MGTTPIYGFPYPDPSDLVANYPALGQELAEDIEAVLPTLGGLTLITSNTFSAVASVSLNNCFTTTYENYKIIFDVTNSASTYLDWRLRLSGTDNTAASWSYQEVLANNTTFLASRSTSQSAGRLTYGDAVRNAIIVELWTPSDAVGTFYQSMAIRGYSTPFWVQLYGVNAVNTAFDGFTLFPLSGTMTGTVRVYGYKE